MTQNGRCKEASSIGERSCSSVRYCFIARQKVRTQRHCGYTKVGEPSNSEDKCRGSGHHKSSEKEDKDRSPTLIDGPETNQENKVAEGNDDERSSTRKERRSLTPEGAVLVLAGFDWMRTNIYRNAN
jgi:hypothetical protein